MTWYLWIYTIGVAFSIVEASATASKCDDVDHQACVLLQKQQPDFCSNDVVAGTICKRFCKMCPVECYHCDTTFTDYHKCNTTILCQEGEVCMKKELISFSDGHHEYEITCQDRKICDGGNDLIIPFGKRHVIARDISIKCCTDDLCNYPKVTTTTTTSTTTTPFPTTTTNKYGCQKDIIFMVDVARNRFLRHNEATIKDLIASVIGRLDIGMTENLVSYYTFDDRLKPQFYFNITDKVALVSRLNSIDLYGASHTSRHNVSMAIHSLLSNIFFIGDRPNYSDVVVIIGNSMTTSNLRMSQSDLNQLQQFSSDVIVVDMGDDSIKGSLHWLSSQHDKQLATDANHIILTSYNDLHRHENVILDKLYQLIIEC